MKQYWKEVFKGMSTTMDLWPVAPKSNIPQDRITRLRRPWERTGQALSRALIQAEREQETQESSAASL